MSKNTSSHSADSNKLHRVCYHNAAERKSTPIYFPAVKQHGSFRSVRKSSSPSTPPSHPTLLFQFPAQRSSVTQLSVCVCVCVCMCVFSSLSFPYALERLLSFKKRERDRIGERASERGRETAILLNADRAENARFKFEP